MTQFLSLHYTLEFCNLGIASDLRVLLGINDFIIRNARTVTLKSSATLNPFRPWTLKISLLSTYHLLNFLNMISYIFRTAGLGTIIVKAYLYLV
jgi:hypothetical protein